LLINLLRRFQAAGHPLADNLEVTAETEWPEKIRRPTWKLSIAASRLGQGNKRKYPMLDGT
jgi:hypothetical protein